MNRNRRNSAWLSGQHLVFMALSLINLKLNLATFGRGAFDLWLLLTSIWGVGSVLDFGFGIAIVSLVARGRSQNDWRLVANVASTGLAVFVGVGLLLVLAGNGVARAWYFTNPQLVPPTQAASAVIVFTFLGVNFFFQYLSVFFRALVEGTEDFVGSSKVAMLNSGLVTLGVLLVYVFGLSMVWLAILYAAAAAVQALAFALLARRRLPEARFSVSHLRVEVLGRLLGAGMAVQVTVLLGALIDPAIKYVLGTSGSRGTVSVYEIARRFSLAISGLFATAFRTHLPKTSVLTTVSEYRRYLTTEGSRLVSAGVTYAAIAFGPLSILLVVLMVYFYASADSVLLFFVLAFAETINIAGYVGYVFLVGTGRASVVAVVQGVNLLLTAISLSVGYQVFGTPIGLLGYGLAVCIGNALMLAVIRRVSGVQVREFVGRPQLMRLMVLVVLLLINVALVAAVGVPLIFYQAGFAVVMAVIFRSDVMVVLGLVRTSLGYQAKQVGGS